MNNARLFNLLVLHGSLLSVTACDRDDGTPPVGDEGGGEDGAEDDGAPAPSSDGDDDGGSAPTDPSETSDGPASTTSASTGGETSDTTSASSEATGAPHSSSGGSEGPALECSDPPNASDTCGCPCCWAKPSCPNTDEVCCAGFTEACTPP
jgi:hypothetical protein